MKHQDNKRLSERQRRNMQFLEDRLQLLDTIRGMIDSELDRREEACEDHPHPMSPPSEQNGRDSLKNHTGEAGDRPCRSLCQRIRSLFTKCQ
jgi:hypothetical protein